MSQPHYVLKLNEVTTSTQFLKRRKNCNKDKQKGLRSKLYKNGTNHTIFQKKIQIFNKNVINISHARVTKKVKKLK